MIVKIISFLPNYTISEFGVIYSKKRGIQRKTHLTHDGYERVALYNKGVQRMYTVHRLVLRTFKGEPPNRDLAASHIDGDKLNNHINNLTWESLSKNNQRKKEHGTQVYGEDSNGAKYPNILRDEVIKLKNEGVKPMKISRQLQLPNSTVHYIIRTWKGVK